jgi:hypothetical protein
VVAYRQSFQVTVARGAFHSVFHVEQIQSLQLIVEEQDDAPSLSQEPQQPEMDDECLTPEVVLHIFFEVISQLSKAEESR